MYRVAILLKDGKMDSKKFPSKEECETWILETMEKVEIKKSIVVNKENIKERFIETF